MRVTAAFIPAALALAACLESPPGSPGGGPRGGGTAGADAAVCPPLLDAEGEYTYLEVESVEAWRLDGLTVTAEVTVAWEGQDGRIGAARSSENNCGDQG